MNRTNLFNVILVIMFLCIAKGFPQSAERKSLLTIARVKYQGGGDWYNDATAIPNLLQFIQRETTMQTAADEKKVEIMDQELFSFPILFMTGHGKISFSEEEAERLRTYLTKGGFLLADDDYGMDKFFRAAMKKVFPDKELVELPFNHAIYRCHFSFNNGLPKIHEHDGGPPQGFALFHEGRMVVFYSYNTNISDGWADPEVHKDPQPVRLRALKMGANIIVYVLSN